MNITHERFAVQRFPVDLHQAEEKQTLDIIYLLEKPFKGVGTIAGVFSVTKDIT